MGTLRNPSDALAYFYAYRQCYGFPQPGRASSLGYLGSLRVS